MSKLKDKVAIVTGGARGIGAAIVARLVDDGAKVLLVDVEESGKATAERFGASCRFKRADVSKTEDVAAIVQDACDAFNGNVDILVNNAAIIRSAPFLTMSDADFSRVLDVNLRAPFLLSQAAARKMVKQVEAGRSPGSIINMSSIVSVLAMEDQAPYCVSKAGISQLTRVMCLALARYGIRVNAVGPGSIATEMLATVASSPEKSKGILSRTPMLRFGRTEEIASVIAFLASDDASYITGQTIFAEGGRLSLNYNVPVGDG